ncbi:unnamed protein product [Oncorhynchus mykiss]|uniref:Protein SHQ1 homolog n=1 Tax=Oncorhynchus mykiss TaxID=8022 RepID=A0A060WAW0_ONCMY|nr:unnamed protein product [Oncorhynchus mykiss]
MLTLYIHLILYLWYAVINVVTYRYVQLIAEGPGGLREEGVVTRFTGTLPWSLQPCRMQLGSSSQCLLDIHKVFQENEPAYLLNDLYITDYCVLIQRVKSLVQMQTAGSLLELSLVRILPKKSHSLWKRKHLDGQLIINQWWRSELESVSICLLHCSRQGKESTESLVLSRTLSLSLHMLGAAAEQYCQATGKLNQSPLSQSQGDETTERHLSLSAFPSASLPPAVYRR